ncbi:Cysteine--tRNA ligase [Gemmata sp. SH-PL17]|uniref:cysteine--tRNA ligase n=1 Tax=Gemmata sp. SH-PL17 TaxID=1630693 RepID=UPI00078D6D29|nr:cysteine--tRNA ligase [Gemmata sp. SH-PL17]AMV30275.1 Cysteine--tRNA ligase [Gemmata sp. SH-PL17]
MALQVYSTLTRKKEPFHKKPGDTVTMYVCGPTVYKPSHIGHMVGPVIFDTVKRYLTYLGYKVKWIVNITDVDDKLINRAKELNTTVPELSAKMTEDYFACLKSLNVTGIDHFPKATDHIGGMIEVIQALIKKDYAYEVDDGVYFDVAKDADYGKLSNRDPEQMEAGARLEPNPKKRNPGDFALWKSKPGEPKEVQFESPFKCGRGRPGWHIECTCMAIKELGETLDIHGGGLDLQFPHHENELAQSESWTDKPFAHIWMHNGLLKLKDKDGKEAKMAGSLGNVLNVAKAIEHMSGDALRYFMLKTHYRSPIDLGIWDWNNPATPLPEGMVETRTAHETFLRFAESVQRVTGKSFADYPAPTRAEPERKFTYTFFNDLYSRFREHLDNDFNTSGAVGVLFDLVKILNGLCSVIEQGDPSTWKRENLTLGMETIRRLVGENSDTPDAPLEPSTTLTPGQAFDEEIRRGQATAKAQLEEGIPLLKEIAQVLGLTFTAEAKALGGGDALVSGLMQLLLDLRNNLRATAKDAAKDNPLKKPLFDQTDLIRKRLGELGVTLEDRPGGTTWRVG